ncbi:hypothetical protein [Streptomyces bacillaris]|uniref:hypothetical protein n=1 Tax=Streptomyces bacillaris TaxID=68179 RepID=UPI00382879BC
MTENQRGTRPAAEERRFQVQWSRDITASTAEGAARVAAGQETLHLFTTDLTSGARKAVMLDRCAVSGAEALRDAAAVMEQRLRLTADDPSVTKSAVLRFLRQRATELDGGVPVGWASVDLEALDAVLTESVGPHGRDEVFGAWYRVMGGPPSHPATASPPVASRIDVVVHRDSDAGTDVHVYVDGVVTEAVVYEIDPGRSGTGHEWWDSVTDLGPEVPQAVLDQVNEYADGYHDPERCGCPCV